MPGKGRPTGRKTTPPPGWLEALAPSTPDPRRTTQAIYYRDGSGHEPVDEFIDALDSVDVQEEVDGTINLLNGLPEKAPPLAFPYSSQVRGELRELRAHYGNKHYRILYRRSKNLFILLHALEKRTGPIPELQIQIATDRFDDFRTRMEANPRVPPRAAGHDAPGKR